MARRHGGPRHDHVARGISGNSPSLLNGQGVTHAAGGLSSVHRVGLLRPRRRRGVRHRRGLGVDGACHGAKDVRRSPRQRHVRTFKLRGLTGHAPTRRAVARQRSRSRTCCARRLTDEVRLTGSIGVPTCRGSPVVRSAHGVCDELPRDDRYCVSREPAPRHDQAGRDERRGSRRRAPHRCRSERTGRPRHAAPMSAR